MIAEKSFITTYPIKFKYTIHDKIINVFLLFINLRIELVRIIIILYKSKKIDSFCLLI
jgi:hypothetical protein